MEKKHPLSEVLESSLEKLKKLVDVNTIIGEPLTMSDDVTIIPISKVSFGFATGGSELPTSKPTSPFGGGSGGGVTIQPLAFLVVSKGDVKLLQMQTADNTADRVVNMVPGVIDKVSGIIQDQMAKKAEKAEQAQEV
ncbi:MAG: GerW family sporulation protein [Candidatus Fimivivens sp.]